MPVMGRGRARGAVAAVTRPPSSPSAARTARARRRRSSARCSRRHGLATFTGGNLGEPLADHADERFDVDRPRGVELPDGARRRRFDPRRRASCSTSPTTTSTATRASTRTRAPRATPSRGRPTSDCAVVPVGDATCLREARRGAGAHRHVRPGRHRRRDRRGASSTGAPASASRARDMALAGGHNALNVAAAIAASRPFGVAADAIRARARDVRGLPHRMALVAEIRRRPLLRRLEGHERRRGGDRARGLRRAARRAHRGRARQGRELRAARRRAAREGARRGAHRRGARTPSRRHRRRRPRRARGDRCARRCAWARPSRAPGDAVLLSPACSSFDMFRDYKHRGDEFVRAVRALEERGGA